MNYNSYDLGQNLRFEKSSTPYCNSPDATFGLMATTNYDVLGRVASVVQTDGGTVSTSYVGNCQTVTDEALRTRKSCTDGLNRSTQVFEDPSGLNYETDYAYDILDNLISVTQKGGASSAGWRTRTFAYDSLSRLLCAANPEVQIVNCPNPDPGTYTAGTVRYLYDSNGNLTTRTAPAPNQTSTGITVTTTYGYDAVNRLIQKSYIDGQTSTVQFAYDGAALSGCTTAPPTTTDYNPIGYRSAMCDGSGATSWAHDAMGRILKDKHTIHTASTDFTKPIIYTYDLDGSLATLAYPDTGEIITYTPSAAGRPVAAQDNANSVNYVLNAQYAPFGGVTGMTEGSITIKNTYNSRLQPLTLLAYIPSVNILSLSYDFHLGAGDNGNVFQITNNVHPGRSQSFTYDALNRIATAQSQATSGNNCWGQLFGHMSGSTFVSGIDAWGNLNEVTVSQCSAPAWGNSAGSNNQILGYCYDAAGNLLDQAACPIGSHTYVYDAESRLISTAGYTYKYDGDGKRVKKSGNGGGTLYWTGTGDSAVAESDLTGTIQREYIFFNGKRVARHEPNPLANIYRYYFADHLGSASEVTNTAGTIQDESLYYPYGGEISFINNDANTYKFTGKERDSESGLDMFGARYYGSSLGRFMTPDWAAKPTAVPYAHYGNPQSLNLYSYVNNNPTTTRDPDGHCTDPFSCGAEFAGIGTLIEPGGGTAVGAVVGGIVGAGIVYFGGKAIINSIHHSDDASNKNAPPPSGSQNQAQSQSTPADPNGNKDDGGTKRTEHGQQRADEARAGDAHRDVGDVNRTISEGKQYTDSETGNNVSVRGNRVVITDQNGNEVRQFKNTRANTQQRIDSGKWVPKPKPEGQ